jgi:hypothetical protein
MFIPDQKFSIPDPGSKKHRIRMFLGLPDPDTLVKGTDPDPSIITKK